MQSNAVTLMDIDDTILQSKRKCGEEDCEPVGYDIHGEPVGFMRRSQRELFDRLTASTTVVPCTARDVATLGRVRLPFPSYKICSYGGCILTPEGTVEPRWHTRISTEATATLGRLEALERVLLAAAADLRVDARIWKIGDNGLPLYLCAKHHQKDTAELHRLIAPLREVLPEGWTLHFNDSNVAAIPGYLGKEHAARWLLSEVLQPALVLGMGDSFVDLPFMGLCHFAMIPSHSQIFSHLRDSGHGFPSKR
jgi:hypothetical protein